MAMVMRPLNYGTGFPVTPYGLAWQARMNGLGESGYVPTPVPLTAEAPPLDRRPGRYTRADARRDALATYGPKVWGGKDRFFVTVDGKAVRFKTMVNKTLKAKRASVNALAGMGDIPAPAPGRPLPYGGLRAIGSSGKKVYRLSPLHGSLVRAPSLNVRGYPQNPGRFGAPRIKKMKRNFETWEKYQGLSGHPTLSSASPRYAAWRGRMYGGLAGDEPAPQGVGFLNLLTTIATTGSQLYATSQASKAADKAAKDALAAAKAQKRAADAALAAEQLRQEGGSMTKPILIAGGVVAALGLGYLLLRKKR